MPAHQCDIDHTIDYAHGGPTTADDLAPLCEPDHLAKHQEGWHYDQSDPDWIIWTSPLGIRYVQGHPPKPGMPPHLYRLAEPKPPDPDDDPPPF